MPPSCYILVSNGAERLLFPSKGYNDRKSIRKESDMQKKCKALRLILFWALAVGWIAVLFFFSGQNAADSSALSGWFVDFVRNFNKVFCQFAFRSFFCCNIERSGYLVVTTLYIVCSCLSSVNL